MLFVGSENIYKSQRLKVRESCSGAEGLFRLRPRQQLEVTGLLCVPGEGRQARVAGISADVGPETAEMTVVGQMTRVREPYPPGSSPG